MALAGLELHNALMGRSALLQHLQRHYMRALLPELYKASAGGARAGGTCASCILWLLPA